MGLAAQAMDFQMILNGPRGPPGYQVLQAMGLADQAMDFQMILKLAVRDPCDPGSVSDLIAFLPDKISLPFARRWKNNSSKSSSTGQFDWPMATEIHISYQLR